jgi:uncharacterized protein YjlB
MKTETLHFADDGDVPNNRLPLIVYRGALSPSATTASAFEALFRNNGWGRMWRSVVFPFHHYHSNSHEALGIAAGQVTLRMGGEAGTTIEAHAGDALLIPAGVGHKRLSSADGLLVVGAYPPGAPDCDLFREGAEDPRIRSRIAQVAMPGTDPVGGAGGPMRELWK